ncbi:glycoside hydrolase family 2 protein [Pedobacter frigiditerrae]|uniref:Glycoside hydrolase family 2 protein n=1 Tax=Pedobacter frigiditerrae TaxID=2530452 RepID=A0A4R0MX31_9SPHI|nr:beta-galactosidase GalA [Pedobacter frigiditerrae]TCC91785.1 glycoside hydrolase family 2 protein [Pedobacter frigiditerrae]
MLKYFPIIVFFLFINCLTTQAQVTNTREHISLDANWYFAFGHPYEPQKDFYNGTSYFSYLSKTGYGDGAAAPGFDDRYWRKLNLPHDWAVEQKFDKNASLSHGFNAVGRNFPNTSVGWYRKTIHIPTTDLGRKISIAFDGVSRNSIVWVNGHYLGTEPSGYHSFNYDITDYVNYGGENVIAVRADVTMEEGWFYEGAGIYRHVWLNKTNPLHVATNGTFVSTLLENDKAKIQALVTVKNDGLKDENFEVKQEVLNAEGKVLGTVKIEKLKINSLELKDFSSTISLKNPVLWSLENPYLHQLVTTISQNGKLIDVYKTTFGIRTIRFDADEGFFLNGKHIKIKGTNNHQDHAGLGVALPDELQYYRIGLLKAMGSNAYRCSHNPPTPELLDACDRLGMLVIDETRLMGTTDLHLNDLKRLMLRDRNHPSIISWSVGNEEWNIEGNITGARVAKTIQAFAKTIDTTRAITAAVSGGIGNGISTTIDMLGYNYIATKNTDEQHQKFPQQLSWGTEEGSTVATRGIYVDDLEKHYLAAYDKKQNDNFLSLENGWKHYASRAYLAGMFIWTGFDYRGEPTPFGWPSVVSYFGMLDLCGFPKDNNWYLKSWWTDEPTLHILPHWNWKGKEGKTFDVWVYSNCDEVELFLNSKSLGKKTMEKNGHLEWKVNYAPGNLKAVGFKNGKKTLTDAVNTTEQAAVIVAKQDKILVENSKVAVVTISVADKKGLNVPTANNNLSFELSGPGKIIGVGNGDPTSLAPEKFLEKIETFPIHSLKEKIVDNMAVVDGIAANYNDQQWKPAFKDERNASFAERAKALIYRGTVDLPEIPKGAKVTFFYKCVGPQQSIYMNGVKLAGNLAQNKKGYEYIIDEKLIKVGKNTVAVIATPFVKQNSWDSFNTDLGLFQIYTPAPQWKRNLFNGLAQVIVEATGEEGEIKLQTNSAGLKSSTLLLQIKK